jgi:hypothetical protein
MRQHNSQIKKKTRQTIADKNRWCSERVSSSCFTSDTRRATVVKIPMISHKKGERNRTVTTTNGTAKVVILSLSNSPL